MRPILLIAMFLVSLPAMPQRPLASLQDRNRVLIVFAPNGQDDRFRTQLARLDGKAMADRDLVLVPVLAQWDCPDQDLRSAYAPFTSDAEQAALRRRFHIPPGAFAVLLLGKDGDEKLRSPTPLAMDQLNQLIDAMPMRQQEMQTRNRR